MNSSHNAYVGLLLAIILPMAIGAPARAESCSRSAQYILENASDDTHRTPAVYRALSKVCEESLQLPNVKDAFVLVSGAIAIVPKRDSISQTATTLAEFCARFPRETLRFVTRGELSVAGDIGRAVRLASSNATSCPTIIHGG